MQEYSPMHMFLVTQVKKITVTSLECSTQNTLYPLMETLNMLAAYTELAEEEGYKLGNDIHILRNGQAQVFNGGV